MMVWLVSFTKLQEKVGQSSEIIQTTLCSKAYRMNDVFSKGYTGYSKGYIYSKGCPTSMT